MRKNILVSCCRSLSVGRGNIGGPESICIWQERCVPRTMSTTVRFKFLDKAQDSHSNRLSGFSP